MRYTVGDREVLDGLDGKFENGPVRVMQETEFFEMLTYERPGALAWR